MVRLVLVLLALLVGGASFASSAEAGWRPGRRAALLAHHRAAIRAAMVRSEIRRQQRINELEQRLLLHELQRQEFRLRQKSLGGRSLRIEVY